MFRTMKFIVRYCSSRLPDAYRNEDGSLRWVDYSVHAASKLGLHNAMLVVHDRLEILHAHGGQSDCAVFLVDGESAERLSPERASALFSALPQGEAKWLDIHDFLLPLPSMIVEGDATTGEQLPLFTHTHTAYDDLESMPHSLDVDV